MSGGWSRQQGDARGKRFRKIFPDYDLIAGDRPQLYDRRTETAAKPHQVHAERPGAARPPNPNIRLKSGCRRGMRARGVLWLILIVLIAAGIIVQMIR